MGGQDTGAARFRAHSEASGHVFLAERQGRVVFCISRHGMFRRMSRRLYRLSVREASTRSWTRRAIGSEFLGADGENAQVYT